MQCVRNDKAVNTKKEEKINKIKKEPEQMRTSRILESDKREIPWKWVVETIMNGGVMSIEEDKEKKKGDREVEGKSGKVVKSNKCEGVLGRAA